MDDQPLADHTASLRRLVRRQQLQSRRRIRHNCFMERDRVEIQFVKHNSVFQRRRLCKQYPMQSRRRGLHDSYVERYGMELGPCANRVGV